MMSKLKADIHAASLARLLTLGVDSSPHDTPIDAKVVAALLSQTLDAPYSRPDATCSAPSETRAGAGPQIRSLIDHLSDTTPSAEMLNLIKNNAKHIAQSESDPHAHAVATVIYFCAIAAASVRLQISITSQSDAELREAFKNLLELDWLDMRLRGLLEEARIWHGYRMESS